MSLSLGQGTKINSQFVIANSGNTYGTNYSYLGVGGFYELATIQDRNNIPIDSLLVMNEDGYSSGRRRLEMIVHTLEDDKYWQLSPQLKIFYKAGTSTFTVSDSTERVTESIWNTLSSPEKLVLLDPTASVFDSTTNRFYFGSQDPATAWYDTPFQVYITGGTYNSGTTTLQLFDTSGNTISITGFSNGVQFDTKVTAFTYSNNKLTITDNSGITYSAVINSFTGLTINGNLNVTSNTTLNNLSANTISATTISGGTLYGDGSNLTNIDNIYTVNGSLTGDRTLNLNDKILNITNFGPTTAFTFFPQTIPITNADYVGGTFGVGVNSYSQFNVDLGSYSNMRINAFNGLDFFRSNFGQYDPQMAALQVGRYPTGFIGYTASVPAGVSGFSVNIFSDPVNIGHKSATSGFWTPAPGQSRSRVLIGRDPYAEHGLSISSEWLRDGCDNQKASELQLHATRRLFGAEATLNIFSKIYGATATGAVFLFEKDRTESENWSRGINNQNVIVGDAIMDLQSRVSTYASSTATTISNRPLGARIASFVESISTTPGSERLGSNLRFYTTDGVTNTRQERLRMVGTTGNILINTTTDGAFKLDVNGTGRFSNTLRLDTVNLNTTDTKILTLDPTNVVRYRTIGDITGATIGNYLPLSGGTVTGATIFQSGLTANTISATTISGGTLFGNGSNLTGIVNIYNADGALTGNRTLNLNSNSLTISGSTSSRFFANGNFGIGTTTDIGYKLDVSGSGLNARIGFFEFLTNQNAGNTGQGIRVDGIDRSVIFQGSGGPPDMFVFREWAGTGNTASLSSVNKSVVRIYGGFGNPNMNNLSGNALWISPYYNITSSTFSTTVRGIYYNPTLSSLTNTTHIAYENTTGLNILNSQSGNTIIGTITDSGNKLFVSASTDPVRFEGIQSGNTDTRILTSDSNGVVRYRNFSDFTGGTGSLSGDYLPLSGGTVTGATIFQSGLTANTISATTYLNLPTDIYTTGFTFNTSTYDLTIERNGGLPNLTQNLSILASDLTVTGGTYDPNTGVATFTNNTGGTFTVSGFLTGYTDTVITAFTYSSNTITINDSSGSTFTVTINDFTGLTVNGNLSVTGNTTLNNLTANTISATTYLGLPSMFNYQITGFTYDDANTFTIFDNSGSTFPATINITTGLTVNGVLSLPNTTGLTYGVVNFGSDSFIHNYGTGNTYVGRLSGSFSGTGSDNTGIGEFVLNDLNNGDDNTGLGALALTDLTGGTFNTALGAGSLQNLVSGDDNTAVGVASNALLQSGSGNTSIGFESLFNNLTGSGNVAIGNKAGYNETGDNKLYIANNDITTLIYGEFDNERVGINTTLPTNAFHVSASTDPVRFEGIQLSSDTRILTSDSNGVVRYRDLSEITGATSADTYVTAFTYNNANTFILTQNSGTPFSATVNTVTGLTINGNLNVTGDTNLNNLTANTISATTISGGTLYGDGSNLTNIDNIYTVDGSLISNRVVNTSTFTLNFSSTTNPDTLILNNGRVGINFLTPLNKLHVVDTSDPVRFDGMQTITSDTFLITANSNGVLRELGGNVPNRIPYFNSSSAITTNSGFTLTTPTGTATLSIPGNGNGGATGSELSLNNGRARLTSTAIGGLNVYVGNGNTGGILDTSKSITFQNNGRTFATMFGDGSSTVADSINTQFSSRVIIDTTSTNMTRSFWGTNGYALSVIGRTMTDTSTTGGSVGDLTYVSVGVPSFSATTGGSYTSFTTLYVAGAPNKTANMTGDTYALKVASGGIFFGGLQLSSDTRILTSDSSGNIRYRNLSDVTGATSADTYTTGGTYTNSTGTLQLRDNSGNTITITGFTTGSTSNLSGDYLPLSGGTVTGGTIFTSGVTANTISATTYLNLPVDPDTYVTGFTYSSNTLTISQNSGSPISTTIDVMTGLTINGNLNINTSFNTTTIITANTGNNTVYSIPTSAYTGAFFDYTVSNSAGLRAGNVMSIWSGTTAKYTEVSTTDIGDTSPITFSVGVSGGNAVLSASATTNNWVVKVIIRSI